MIDVRDILDLGDDLPVSGTVGRKPAPQKKSEIFKRPEGMSRELYSLLCADGGKNLELAPLLPTDAPGGYKRKLDLGAKKVRKWSWTPFTNPGRTDGAVFYHWRRIGEENREYPFAKFNKEVPVVKYSESEYSNHLEKDGWTKEETDHLFDLARRFDLRFTVMQDRYNPEGSCYPRRTIEDIKERYYNVNAILLKLRADPEHEPQKPFHFDAEHERRRKLQLNKLWNRTPEQAEEEEFLRSELKRIEHRKREREKKTQDLQKLITAADGGGTPGPVDGGKKDLTKKLSLGGMKKKVTGAKGTLFTSADPPPFYGLKWPDFKNPGITTRSGRMRLPVGIGQKKAKVVDGMLRELGVDPHPYQSDEINSTFNDLRSDIVLHYELKSILGTCETEIEALKHQYEAMKPGETLQVPKELEPAFPATEVKCELGMGPAMATTSSQSPSTEVQSTSTMLAPSLPRKRKAALEQGNVLRRLKNKM